MGEPKAEVNVELADNGCMVTVKMKRKVIGSRVFEGKDHFERSQKWARELIDKHNIQPNGEGGE